MTADYFISAPRFEKKSEHAPTESTTVQFLFFVRQDSKMRIQLFLLAWRSPFPPEMAKTPFCIVL